jgi:hypothetical protein
VILYSYLLYVLYVTLLCVLGDDFVEQLKRSFRVPFGVRRSWLKLFLCKFQQNQRVPTQLTPNAQVIRAIRLMSGYPTGHSSSSLSRKQQQQICGVHGVMEAKQTKGAKSKYTKQIYFHPIDQISHSKAQFGRGNSGIVKKN